MEANRKRKPTGGETKAKHKLDESKTKAKQKQNESKTKAHRKQKKPNGSETVSNFRTFLYIFWDRCVRRQMLPKLPPPPAWPREPTATRHLAMLTVQVSTVTRHLA
jgi:hypothetical protein